MARRVYSASGKGQHIVYKGQHILASGTEILRDGSLAVDLATNTLYIHDGVTPGGVALTDVQKVAVPANSYGVTGNQADMLAFDSSYIYYCFASFRPLVTYTAAVSTNGGSTFEVYQTAGTPLIGDRLYGSVSGPGVPISGGEGRITNVQASTEGGQPTWLLTINQVGGTSIGVTVNQSCTIGTPDIWKRTAHGAGTW